MSDTLNYDYPPGASPQEIWAILREVTEGHKEARLRMQETERIVRETSEQMKKTEEQMKRNDKKFGELHNRFGELAEHMVAPSIKEKFNALGYTFEEMSSDKRIYDALGNTIAEVDILLENGDTVMAVEVKAKPKDEDVAEHLSLMEVLRRRADSRQDRRRFQGAVAGAIMSDSVRRRIQKNGFYAIEQTGDTVMINIPEGWTPRQW